MGAAYELIWNYSYGSVTIDAICERARVKKGSFYYFFDSKADLATAAINAWWDERKVVIAEIFRPEIPPLERIRRYIDFAAQRQFAAYEETGRVLGCPIFTLGSEISGQNEPLRRLVDSILSYGRNLFEQAICEAQEAGEIEGGNAAFKARAVMAFYEGMFTSARIDNNPEMLADLGTKALHVIGVRPALAAMA